jgi:hypothetical protein
VSPSADLKTETHAFAEKVVFSTYLEFRKMDKVLEPVILNKIPNSEMFSSLQLPSLTSQHSLVYSVVTSWLKTEPATEPHAISNGRVGSILSLHEVRNVDDSLVLNSGLTEWFSWTRLLL